MSTEQYRAALEALGKEYEALGEQRRQIDQRLGELAQSISTLSRLCGYTPTVPWGLTDACRTVLRSAGLAMTPLDLRDRLKAIGCDLSRYTNDLAAVHTVLKRLNDSGEIRFVTNGAGKKAYIWEKPAQASSLGPDIAEALRKTQTERPSSHRKKSK